MRLLRFALLLAVTLAFLVPAHAHAQTWTPCPPTGNVCTSAVAACQAYSTPYEYSIFPTYNAEKPYQCNVVTCGLCAPAWLYVTCPKGYVEDPNVSSGCSLPVTVQNPGLIGGEGLCPPPAQSTTPAPCSSDPDNKGNIFGGEPINLASGNVFYAATDYETTGQNVLRFTRYYNSRGTTLLTLGVNWRSTFNRNLLPIGLSSVIVTRSSGQILTFSLIGSVWTPNSDVDITLTNSGSTWTLTDHDDTVETYTGSSPVLTSITARNGYKQTLNYNTSGQLATVTDSYGRSLTFAYNSSGLLQSLATPDGTTITYGYTSTVSGQNLTSVTFPTSPSSTVMYVYDAPEIIAYPINIYQLNALTGVIDENNNRFLTWSYDAFGRGLTSQVGNGPTANLTTVSYNDTTGTRTVTNSLGVIDTYTFATLQGVPRVTGISRAATASTAAASRSFSYDGNGYMTSKTDWNGNLTKYVNDVHGQPTTINEAVGSSVVRTTTIAYDNTFVHLPDSIATSGLKTSFTYEAVAGNVLTQTLTDTTTSTQPYSTNGQARTWTFAYTTDNLNLKSVTTPNLHTTSFAYTSGVLTSLTDALRHETRVTSYTVGGLPKTIVDPNNVTTNLTYDQRLRLLTSTVITSAGNLISSRIYYNNSDVTTILPDSSFLTTLRDTAHRLIAVADNFDNQIDWNPVDALGDPMNTATFDPTGQIHFLRAATFDALGRKLQDTSTVTGKSTVFTYDNNGNALTITDPLGHKTTQAFDALNRLSKVTDVNGSVTTTTYDAHDRPLSVTDPNGAVTTYVYDGFGDLIQQTSPHSGATVYRYDADGNLTQKVDAAGVVTNRTYDALDRPLTTTYPADSAENITNTYDQAGHGFGTGRLTSVTDAAGTLNRSYDERGNMVTEKRVTNETPQRTLTTSYTYDKASRIASITYPSGAVVSYAREANGDIYLVGFAATGADAKYVGFNVTHLPFGQMSSITYNNGDQSTFTFDQDYRMTNLAANSYPGTSSFINWTYTFDAANNVTAIKDSVTAAKSQSFGYDTLNRLIAASSAGTYGSFSYAYDKVGNLLTQNTSSYSYAAGTNRLDKITTGSVYQTLAYTATGNINSFTPNTGAATTMSYNNANRLASVTTPSQKVSYTYDAFGHRIFKTLPGTPNSVYLYGQDGTLQEEIDNGIATDYLYLDGVYVANWQPSQHHLYMINSDRLGTPLVSRDEYGLTNWAAYYQPYGGRTVTVSSGQFSGPVTQSKVFPGQEFDAATGLYQNGFRDYVPGFGRYLEADPIGLAGGLNLYEYASANPIAFVDPYGTQDRPKGLPEGIPIPTIPGATGGEDVPSPPVTPLPTGPRPGDNGSTSPDKGRCPGS